MRRTNLIIFAILVFAISPLLINNAHAYFSYEIAKVSYGILRLDGLTDPDALLRVVVELAGGNPNEFSSVASSFGFLPELTVDTWVQGRIPLRYLRPLSRLASVRFIREPFKPILLETVSEGVGVIGANVVHDAGYTGEGVKVAVLDVGFDVNNPEIKENIGEFRSFRFDGDIRGDDPEGTRHGTGVAEIVVDVAPDVSLYLYNFNTESEFVAAVNFAVSRNVQIITTSVGWANVGPTDGTSRISRAIDSASDAGIIFTVAAGNQARRHWEGTFNDLNGDDWHEFSNGDNTNDIEVRAGEEVSIYLSWDDWPVSNQDYDLYLLDSNNTVVASSQTLQFNFAPPAEDIQFEAAADGTLQIAIKRRDADQTPRMELYIFTHHLEYRVESSSLVIPGDAGGAVVVGASTLASDQAETFSSRGPTDDGRIKPDLVAPNGVSTLSYEPEKFFGSSASTPHVAGAAALLFSVDSTMTATTVESLLANSARDGGEPGKDNTFGFGRVDVLAAFEIIRPSIGQKTLSVHAHPSSVVYPNEPPQEIPISIATSYLSNGSIVTSVLTTRFSIVADANTNVNLTVFEIPFGYGWAGWENVGVERVGSMIISIRMDEDRTAVAYLEEVQQTFLISVTPPAQTSDRSSSVNFTIIVQSVSGFNQPVELALSGGLTSEFEATILPNPIAPQPNGLAQATLQIIVSGGAAAGQYTILVTGSSGGVQRVTSVVLTVIQNVGSQAPSHTLTLRTNIRGVQVEFEVDGASHVTSDGKVEIAVSEGRHVIRIPNPRISASGNTFTFSSWSGAATGSSNPLEIDVQSDMLIVANFSRAIPGFPLESIVLGFIVAILPLFVKSRIRNRRR